MIIKALPGQTLTFKTNTDLKEGDFVSLSGSMAVEKAGSGEMSIGVVVVAPDMGLVSVLVDKPVVELTAGETITAGDVLESGESGVIPNSGGNGVGIALRNATTGGKVWVALAGQGAKGPKGDKGDPGPAGFGTKEQYNDIIARLEALEEAGA